MSHYICQRFLKNPEKRHGYFFVEVQAVDHAIDVALDAGPFTELLGLPLDAGDSPRSSRIPGLKSDEILRAVSMMLLMSSDIEFRLSKLLLLPSDAFHQPEQIHLERGEGLAQHIMYFLAMFVLFCLPSVTRYSERLLNSSLGFDQLVQGVYPFGIIPDNSLNTV